MWQTLTTIAACSFAVPVVIHWLKVGSFRPLPVEASQRVSFQQRWLEEAAYWREQARTASTPEMEASYLIKAKQAEHILSLRTEARHATS